MSKANKRFVTVSFNPSREPVDEMFWCEAEYDGSWTKVILLDRVKTRREIIERIVELESGLVTFNFPFSFPKPFIKFLQAQGIGASWQTLSEKIREDLKKNTDDGIRIWIEQMGKYRESNLESQDEAMSRMRRPVMNQSGRRNPRPMEPYELRSKAERFRRIDMILRRKDEAELESTLGIRYNKLTSRYEFTSSEARGRAALVGVSMLRQILEQKPEAAVWPFMRPAALTLAEVDVRLFPKPPKADKLQAYFDLQEDNALFVERDVKEAAGSSEVAQRVLFTLLGIISAERRENKTIRPLRDYRDSFYASDDILTEGWSYGIGFKEPEQEKPARPAKQRETRQEKPVEVIASEQPIAEVHSEPVAVVATAEPAVEAIAQDVSEEVTA